MSHFPKIIIILVLFISKIEAAEHSNNFVLECFALDDLKHDIRYYSVINYNLFYRPLYIVFVCGLRPHVNKVKNEKF